MQSLIRTSLSFCCLTLSLICLAGCDPNASTAAAKPSTVRVPDRLTIITPHNEEIRNAFEVNFSNWRLAQQRNPVVINWVYRGTPQCVDYINAVNTLSEEEGPRLVPDIMFGGGIADHNLLHERGHSVSLKLDDVLKDIPSEVAGVATRHPEGHWFATGLSSFGILYNEAACKMRGIEPPTTWTDLADPRFFGWIGIGDPAASGSNRECMVLVMQQADGGNNYGTLARIIANSRAMQDRSGDVLKQVATGSSLAAFAVNFDGQRWEALTGGKVKYINPKNATAVTPDGVSVLSSSQNKALAEEFVRFVLSEEGQMLWGVSASGRTSYGENLYHYPILPSVYEHNQGKMCVKENPFKESFGPSYDATQTAHMRDGMVPLVKALSDENHILMQRAWEAIIKAGMPEAALATLTSLPCTHEEAVKVVADYRKADRETAEEMLKPWQDEFRRLFEKAIEQAKASEPS